MKNNRKISVLSMLMAVVALPACTQNIDSNMNISRPVLEQKTVMSQLALNDINQSSLTLLAQDYKKNGSGPLELTMAFDPYSKSFTAMSALHELGHIKDALASLGVKNVVTETLAVKGAEPAMMVAYDTVTARAADDCTMMPGVDVNQTTRHMAGYKFGCSVDTMLTKQIARPADLAGVGGVSREAYDGRRDANVVEGYASGAPRPPLDTIGRGDLGSE